MLQAATDSRLVTAEELLAMPDDDLRREIIDGKVVTMAPAGFEHGRLNIRLSTHLHLFVLQHRLGEMVAAETGFILSRDPDTVLAPDAAFIRADQLTQDLPQGFGTMIPDLVLETASPSDTKRAMQHKARVYLDAGVRVVLLLFPRGKTLHVLRGDDVTILTAADSLVIEDLLPGFRLPLKDVFASITDG